MKKYRMIVRKAIKRRIEDMIPGREVKREREWIYKVGSGLRKSKGAKGELFIN